MKSTSAVRKATYIIDFDSTFTQVEALDELARISLKRHPDRARIYEQIDHLTNLSMDGKLSFRESLHQRVGLLEANASHLKQLITRLKKKVSASFLRNKAFFERHANDVLIVSGGFKEFIIPVVSPYHIPKENIYANSFLFDKKNNIVGYDQENPLSEEGGKVKLLKNLNLSGDVYGIGDGYSDFQLKEWGMIKKFFAFTENIERKAVLEKADHITPSFDEFLYVNNLPMALSYPKNRILCLILGEVSAESIQLLKKDGFSVTQADQLDEKSIAEMDMLLMSDREKLDQSKLSQAAKLKVVGYLGNAKPNLPVLPCTQMGIVIFDDPKANPRNSSFIPKRMIDFINKGDTYLSVNFPNLQLPRIKDAHRLIHIHQNVPGVMAQINQVFARNGINIVGQFLMTNAEIGYVITDINTQYDRNVLKDLKQIQHTIKFRVLY